ncbi:GNAT family N-acetyltransferase [Streptomyces sp. NPDC018610]|uniref:GNAT family N-acetyltransferase n=1 Tax=Streptomyces sp. NPDC018610 TaxID=3365049 RepID=UPI0037A15754
MDRPNQIIECGDIVLRRWRQDDVARVSKLIEESSDHLRPWMPWVAGHSEERAREFLAKSESNWVRGETFNYAVSEGGTLVGMCQAYRVEAEPPGWRMGYWLHPAAVGRGIATRATAALVTEMFTLPQVRYLEITHDVANTSSAGVPRRLGFTEIGHEEAMPPAAPSCRGVDVVWRLNRPAPPVGGACAP